MTHTLTTTLSDQMHTYLELESSSRKTTKKKVLEESLVLHRQIKLKNQIEIWLKERYKEYQEINDDFSIIQFNSLKNK